jgi:hypothetical protein
MKEKVHDKCIGCQKVDSDQFCLVYSKPSIWWDKRGGCPMATHAGKKVVVESKKVNPLKVSRRSKRRIK